MIARPIAAPNGAPLAPNHALRPVSLRRAGRGRPRALAQVLLNIVLDEIASRRQPSHINLIGDPR
jgi:hypothetical protein